MDRDKARERAEAFFRGEPDEIIEVDEDGKVRSLRVDALTDLLLSVTEEAEQRIERKWERAMREVDRAERARRMGVK